MEKKAGKRAKEIVQVIASCRWTVAFMIFFGCILLYIMRINMSVAVVCMTYDVVENNITTNGTSMVESGFESNFSRTDSYCPDLEDPENHRTNVGEFGWSRQLRGWILSSFFYGYTMTQFPAGWLAHKYGGKIIVTISIGVTMLGTMLSPVAARTHVYFLIAVRVIMGLASGLYFPGVAQLWATWAPPLERSQLATFGYAGNPIGCILGFAVSGLLCEHGFDGGWPSVFYVYGIAAVLWLIFFWFLIYDTPADHPRIKAKERDYIEKSLGTEAEEHLPIPWVKFWTSVPLWALILADIANSYGLWTFLSALPQYMKDILKFDIEKGGLANSLPYLVDFVVAVVSSFVVDWVRRKGFSTTVARKIVETISLFPGAIFMIAIAFLDCTQPMIAIAFLCLAVGLSGAHRSGAVANQLDIAPRYAGLVMGVSNCLCNIMGFVAPTIYATLVPTGALVEWQRVFFITAAVQIAGSLIYLFFASGEVQEWAKPQKTEISLSQSLVEDSEKPKTAEVSA